MVVIKEKLESELSNIQKRIEDLTWQEQQIQSQLSDLEEHTFPKLGDKYFYITANIEVSVSWYDGSVAHKDRVAAGNVFGTREAAEFEIERLKVFAELKEFAEPRGTYWGSNVPHWYISYDYDTSELDYDWTPTIRCAELYFESDDKARQAVEAVGEERVKKYYLGLVSRN